MRKTCYILPSLVLSMPNTICMMHTQEIWTLAVVMGSPWQCILLRKKHKTWNLKKDRVGSYKIAWPSTPGVPINLQLERPKGWAKTKQLVKICFKACDVKSCLLWRVFGELVEAGEGSWWISWCHEEGINNSARTWGYCSAFCEALKRALWVVNILVVTILAL